MSTAFISIKSFHHRTTWARRLFTPPLLKAPLTVCLSFVCVSALSLRCHKLFRWVFAMTTWKQQLHIAPCLMDSNITPYKNVLCKTLSLFSFFYLHGLSWHPSCIDVLLIFSVLSSYSCMALRLLSLIYFYFTSTNALQNTLRSHLRNGQVSPSLCHGSGGHAGNRLIHIAVLSHCTYRMMSKDRFRQLSTFFKGML